MACLCRIYVLSNARRRTPRRAPYARLGSCCLKIRQTKSEIAILLEAHDAIAWAIRQAPLRKGLASFYSGSKSSHSLCAAAPPQDGRTWYCVATHLASLRRESCCPILQYPRRTWPVK
eukprot:6192296-Pleurochrysis_carterae.AAC.1